MPLHAVAAADAVINAPAAAKRAPSLAFEAAITVVKAETPKDKESTWEALLEETRVANELHREILVSDIPFSDLPRILLGTASDFLLRMRLRASGRRWLAFGPIGKRLRRAALSG